MIYSNQELNAIIDAMATPSYYLNAAAEIFDTLYSRYFECSGDVEQLQLDAQFNPKFIQYMLFAGTEMIREAKCSIDAFIDPQSIQLKSYIAQAEELKNISVFSQQLYKTS